MLPKIIIGTHASGKTTKLIREACATGFTIVCNNMQRCQSVIEQANSLQIAIRTPIPFRDFLERRYYGLGCAGFLFDDIDLILQGLSPLPIGAITLTNSGNVNNISMASVKPEEGKFVAPHAPRPAWGDKIRKELAEIVGGEVYMWDGGQLDSLEQCIGYIYKLLKYHPNDDGYRLARELENDNCFTPDTELVDILDGVQYKKYELINKAVKEWVKEYALTLDFEVGQKVIATVNRRGKVETSEFEVVKLYPETMQYGLWNESLGYSEREGCLLVEFEKVTALTTHIGDSREVDKHES